MNPETPIIDVPMTVIPLEGSIASPVRALATLRGRENIFAPAENPEMRGRRPSGVIMHAKDVPEGYAEPLHTPPEFAINKRSAKGVAEELTGCPCSVWEEGGRCHLEVVFPMARMGFSAISWFLLAASLKAHLDKVRYVKPARNSP